MSGVSAWRPSDNFTTVATVYGAACRLLMLLVMPAGVLGAGGNIQSNARDYDWQTGTVREKRGQIPISNADRETERDRNKRRKESSSCAKF